jgi:hypothetical protein
MNGFKHIELLLAFGFIYGYDLSGKFIQKHHVTNDYLRAVHELNSLNKDTVIL